jgi:hypothetical protein
MIFGLSMEPAKRQGRPHQDAATDRSIPTAEVSRAPPRDNAKGRCKTDQDVIDHLLAATVDPEVPLHFGDTWGEVPQSGCVAFVRPVGASGAEFRAGWAEQDLGGGRCLPCQTTSTAALTWADASLSNAPLA